MKQCKPCITIRMILKILWLNSKLFISNVRNDIRSYSNINATVCELDKTTDTVDLNKLTEPTRNTLTKLDEIRREAQNNYIPSESHGKRMLADAAKTWLHNVDRSKADPKLVQWAEMLIRDYEQPITMYETPIAK